MITDILVSEKSGSLHNLCVFMCFYIGGLSDFIDEFSDSF